MTQPVLEIQEARPEGSVTVNLLPCKIHHDGPIGPLHAHWTVENPKDETPTAHFRGRKLHGKTIKIPQGHLGVLVQRAEDVVHPSEAENSTDERGEGFDAAPEGKLRTAGEFQDLVIWGHESVADSSSDHYIRGMEEWIDVSKKIHSFTPETNGEKQP